MEHDLFQHNNYLIIVLFLCQHAVTTILIAMSPAGGCTVGSTTAGVSPRHDLLCFIINNVVQQQ
jgi:hypothetical protein